MSLAKSRLELRVTHLVSEDAAATVVAKAAATVAPDEWIAGRGWDQTLWPGQRFPTRMSLDRAAPAHPVALTRIDGHAIWANTAALRVAGPSAERFERAIEDAVAECLAKGLTGIHEMGVDRTTLAAYRRLAERGKFPFRNYVALSGKKAWAEYRQLGRETIRDGHRGLVLIPPEELERLLGEARDAGFQACVHAIGDRANTMALDAMEKIGVAGRRFRIEHAQILARSDLPRFASLGVIPSMQPTHCTSDMRWAGARLGADRLPGAYAWRSLLDTGTIIAGGSDFPVEDPNPFHGLHAAITRRPLEGDHPGWQPEQRMTRAEAVQSFTRWNAWAAGQEAELGSLERGKRADLVVLSDDVMTCNEATIKAVVPVMSMVGGEIVHMDRKAV